jgi:hypothetical protein
MNNAIEGHLTKKEAFFAMQSLLLFIIGATSRIDFALVGRTTVGEMLAFAAIPILWISQPDLRRNSHFVKVFSILAMITVAVWIADFINKMPLWFSMRSAARPIFMGLWVLFFIPIIRKNLNVIKYFIYGSVIAGAMNYFRPSGFETEAAADVTTYAGIVFRLSPLIGALTLAGVFYIYPRSRVLAALIVLANGVVGIAMGGARSSFINYFAIACLLLLIAWFRSKQKGKRIEITPQKIALLGCVGMMALTMVYGAYIYAAPQGYLGEEQRAKFEAQRNTALGVNPLGFILGGRTQVYGAVLGIIDRPILGFGSWNREATYPYVIEAIASVGTDPKVLEHLMNSGGIMGAGHSILFQTWVENGIIPAIGYLMLYGILCRVLLFNIRYEGRITPLIVMWWASYSWAFLFSPPSFLFRLHFGLVLAIYIVFMDKKGALGRPVLLP